MCKAEKFRSISCSNIRKRIEDGTIGGKIITANDFLIVEFEDSSRILLYCNDVTIVPPEGLIIYPEWFWLQTKLTAKDLLEHGKDHFMCYVRKIMIAHKLYCPYSLEEIYVYVVEQLHLDHFTMEQI